MTKTLIFPYVGKEAEAYARNATERGEQWFWFGDGVMPTIHDSKFKETFLYCVNAEKITHLFCPVASVHKFMETFDHGLVLLGESPIRRAMREHRELMERVAELASRYDLTPYTVFEVAGVLKAAMNIYGESNEEKIAAMMRIFTDAPGGDVVEVGCLMGRTALVLRWLSIRYRRFLLTVDPWSPTAGVQNDSPPLLRAMTEEWDWALVAEAFAVNLAPLGHLNHLRMPSADAFTEYAKDFDSSRIAVLHIDGNHDYDSVTQDILLWRSCMMPGSWLVLDDYAWAHGDGPRRAGDELLAEGRHEGAFEAGGALFMRFR